ncbi:hypothetical protein RHGRI_022012 [Rhododendron griersonianum]|uniref:RNase H type-1 domain-containing protein n=1 Tax=Rhododendron griersonianum TaxID=479676 RepID=A0AAV6JM86_9ERIC|nr:hypothetical protein RHGRI_022012 [Rhododendron griersonianum]
MGKESMLASPLAAGFFLNSIGSVGGWSMNVKEQIDGGILESDFLAKAIFLAWYIWKARNELVFQSVSSSPYVPVTHALGACDEFVSAKECLSSGRQGHPPPPFLANSPLDSSYGDFRGRLIDGRRFRISTNSAFLAVASVIREACHFAKALDINSTTVENDNAQLISLSVSELVSPRVVTAIISDILSLAAELKLSFRWTPRDH